MYGCIFKTQQDNWYFDFYLIASSSLLSMFDYSWDNWKKTYICILVFFYHGFILLSVTSIVLLLHFSYLSAVLPKIDTYVWKITSEDLSIVDKSPVLRHAVFYSTRIFINVYFRFARDRSNFQFANSTNYFHSSLQKSCFWRLPKCWSSIAEMDGSRISCLRRSWSMQLW